MEDKIKLTIWEYDVVVFMVYCLNLISYSEYVDFSWPLLIDDEGEVDEPNDLSRKFGSLEYKKFYELYEENHEWLDLEYCSAPITSCGYCGTIPEEEGVNKKQYMETQLQIIKQKVVAQWVDKGEKIETVAKYIINDY